MLAEIRRSFFKQVTNRVLRRSPDMAVEFYRREVAHHTRRFGKDDARTLVSRGNYAAALHRRGESEIAEAELAEVIARWAVTAASPDPSFLLRARTWHGHMLFDLQRFEESEREWRTSSLGYAQLLGSDHPDTLDAHASHAAALYKLERFQEAEAEMADVVARLSRSQGADSADALRAWTSYAEYLRAVGRDNESEEAWRKVAEDKGKVLGAAHPDTSFAQEKHAIALYRQGKLEEAALEFTQVAGQLERRLGADHTDTKRVKKWRDAALAGLHQGHGPRPQSTGEQEGLR